MQVSIHEEDRPALRFLWSYNGKVPQYEYTRLIFGATCSPFCAICALQKCALDNKDSFPLAYDAILNSFYMDDYIASVPTLGEAQCVSRETKESLNKVVFVSPSSYLTTSSPCNIFLNIDHDEIKTSTLVLGQNWKIDIVEFFVDPLQNFPTLADNYTQRKLFSLLSSIFDPLGIIAPLTIRLKALLQQIWRLGLNWDNQIPSDYQHKLQKILNSFQIKAVNRGVWKYTHLLTLQSSVCRSPVLANA